MRPSRKLHFRKVLLTHYKCAYVQCPEVGIYKKKQESKKTRKHELDQESDEESDQE